MHFAAKKLKCTLYERLPLVLKTHVRIWLFVRQGLKLFWFFSICFVCLLLKFSLPQGFVLVWTTEKFSKIAKLKCLFYVLVKFLGANLFISWPKYLCSEFAFFSSGVSVIKHFSLSPKQGRWLARNKHFQPSPIFVRSECVC